MIGARRVYVRLASLAYGDARSPALYKNYRSAERRRRVSDSSYLTELPARYKSEVGVNGGTAYSGPLAQLAEELTLNQ